MQTGMQPKGLFNLNVNYVICILGFQDRLNLLWYAIPNYTFRVGLGVQCTDPHALETSVSKQKTSL